MCSRISESNFSSNIMYVNNEMKTHNLMVMRGRNIGVVLKIYFTTLVVFLRYKFKLGI